MPIVALNIALQDVVHTFYYLEEILSCQLKLYLVNIKNQLMNDKIITTSSKHEKSE